MALPVCTISDTGILKPDYATVLAYFEEQFRGIYGTDVYIDPDSQDGQMLAIFAAAVDDANALTMQAYQAFSPATARGVGLSSVVKINGISRRVASYSTVDLLITGQAGTGIVNGIAQSSDGTQWLLPALATIPPDGDITVTATAKDLGATLALPGEIETIGTPTRGWQGVTNLSAATPGAAVETDAELRRRQALSTALPSRSVFEATVGAVASVPGVVRFRGYENDSGATDGDGIPGHSISIVVEGGDSQTIGEAIASNKTPGTGTYGTTSIDVTDEWGVTRAINFYRPTVAQIKVDITLTAQTGYTAVIEQSIKDTIATWISDLEIGEDVEWSEVFLPANLFGASGVKTYKISALTIAKNAGSFGTSDLVVAFNEAPTTTAADVDITVTP
jgi:uncharacterized phage protein gp47/JayE